MAFLRILKKMSLELVEDKRITFSGIYYKNMYGLLPSTIFLLKKIEIVHRESIFWLIGGKDRDIRVWYNHRSHNPGVIESSLKFNRDWRPETYVYSF